MFGKICQMGTPYWTKVVIKGRTKLTNKETKRREKRQKRKKRKVEKRRQRTKAKLVKHDLKESKGYLTIS